MNASIFETQTKSPGFELNVSLKAEDPAVLVTDKFGTLMYKATRADETAIIEFLFDVDGKDLDIKLSNFATLKVNCLAVCGLSLVGAVLDCYRKHKHDWSKFKKCMEDQGNTLGTAVVACILGCEQ